MIAGLAKDVKALYLEHAAKLEVAGSASYTLKSATDIL